MSKNYSYNSKKKDLDLIEKLPKPAEAEDANVEGKSSESKNSDEVDVNDNAVYIDEYNNISTPRVSIDITWRTILTILGLFVAIYLGSRLIQVMLILFFAFVLSSSLLPLVKKLTKRGLSKGSSIAVVYFGLLFGVLAVGTMIVVPFASEMTQLKEDIPEIIDTGIDRLANQNIPFFNVPFFSSSKEEVKENLITFVDDNLRNSVPFFTKGFDGLKKTLSQVFGIAGGVLTVFFTIILSIYMVADHDTFLDTMLHQIVNQKKRDRVKKLVMDVEDKLGDWLLGQVVLSLIIGVITWIMLTILNVPFALPLAVLAGLLEAVPNLGPLIASIPAFFIALFAGGPAVGFFVLLGYTVIQQLENNIIVPKVMSTAVGLKPIVVMIGVLVGFDLAGVVGAIIAVPVLVILKIAYEFYLDLQKLKAKGIV